MFIEMPEGLLSEDNLKKHYEYYRQLKAKLSLLEKSFTKLDKEKAGKVKHEKIPLDVKAEARWLDARIKSHELFFRSFGTFCQKSTKLGRYYSSERAFMYDVYMMGKRSHSEFLYIVFAERAPIILADASPEQVYSKYKPSLAIDLCEHSYFLDYGFDRDEYLRRCASLLKLNILNTQNNS